MLERSSKRDITGGLAIQPELSQDYSNFELKVIFETWIIGEESC
jgi:hypothetical protein